jgi:hypothetical protein
MFAKLFSAQRVIGEKQEIRTREEEEEESKNWYSPIIAIFVWTKEMGSKFYVGCCNITLERNGLSDFDRS